jgi:hypothetical protein
MQSVYRRETDYLRVYMLQSADPDRQRRDNERTTERVQTAGFNLIFDISDMKDYTAGGDMHAFENTLYENEPGVHIVYHSLAYNHLDLLGDFYSQAQAFAPWYLHQAKGINNAGSFTLMPTSIGRFSKQPAVFVRNDIYRAHGAPIRNANDLEELLGWLLEKKPDAAPCLVWHSLYPYVGLEFFLPGMGYTSLQTVFAEWGDMDTLLWMNNETGEIHPFYNMPASREAVQRYHRWMLSGLIEHAEGRVDPSEYPVVLVNTADLRTVNGNAVTERLLGAMSGYTLNVFSSPAVYYSDNTYLAVAPRDTDVSEFLRFMEWLDDIANYRYFMYGTDGEEDNTGCTFYFRRRVFENVLEDCPYDINGYPQALSLDIYLMHPAYQHDSLTIITRMSNHLSYRQDYQRALDILNGMLVGLRNTQTETEANFIIDDAFDKIRSLEKIDAIERLLKEP